MSTPTIIVDDSAVKVIGNMQRQVVLVSRAWNRTPFTETAQETAESLAKVLAQLLTGGWGEASVYADSGEEGCLSLYVRSGIHFGIIAFPKHRVDPPEDTDPRSHFDNAPRMGRYCWARKSDTNYVCFAPVYQGKPTCEGHQPLIMATPVPMTWSMHS
jgi:hypothetical protein